MRDLELTPDEARDLASAIVRQTAPPVAPGTPDHDLRQREIFIGIEIDHVRSIIEATIPIIARRRAPPLPEPLSGPSDVPCATSTAETGDPLRRPPETPRERIKRVFFPHSPDDDRLFDFSRPQQPVEADGDVTLHPAPTDAMIRREERLAFKARLDETIIDLQRWSNALVR